MESLKPNAEVRLAVAHCFQTLSKSTESKDITTTLQHLASYLDEGPESPTTSVQRTEFRRTHFTRTLQFLVNNIQADWLHNLTTTQRTELWDSLFLRGPPEQALLVLMEGIGQLRWVLCNIKQQDSFCICSFDMCHSSCSTARAQVWTTWLIPLRSSFRVVVLLIYCGPSVWRLVLLTHPSLEKLYWGV